MVCKVFKETGQVPMDCLFGHCVDGCEHHGDKPPVRVYQGPKCKRCGSMDVRWRQQGGRWVLFSLEPGKLHQCGRISASEDFK